MNKKYTIENIKKIMLDFSYELLSNEYKNNTSKLKIKCDNNHIFITDMKHFKRGHKCPECSKNKKHTIENIKEYIESLNYKLLSSEYINTLTKLTLQCPEGHIYLSTYSNFQQGKRCPVCFGTPKKTLENVSKYIEMFGYKVLSTEYITNNTKLKLSCPNNHTFKMSYSSFHTGQRCPLCSYINSGSIPEKEIAEYTKAIYSGEVIENDRTQVKNYFTNYPLELDIYIPKSSKAIEFNGKYWHNNDYIKWKDEMKRKQCMKRGIDLLVIDEKEWCKNKDQIFKNIKIFLKEIR